MTNKMDGISQNGNDGDHYLLGKKYWGRKGKYRFDNGDYTISVAIVEGKHKYSAWYKKELLKVHDDPQEARSACQSHFMSINSPQ